MERFVGAAQFYQEFIGYTKKDLTKLIKSDVEEYGELINHDEARSLDIFKNMRWGEIENNSLLEKCFLKPEDIEFIVDSLVNDLFYKMTEALFIKKYKGKEVLFPSNFFVKLFRTDRPATVQTGSGQISILRGLIYK